MRNSKGIRYAKTLLLGSVAIAQLIVYADAAEDDPSYVSAGGRLSSFEYVSLDAILAKNIRGDIPTGPIAKLSVGAGGSAAFLGVAIQHSRARGTSAFYVVDATRYSGDGNLSGIGYDYFINGHIPMVFGVMALKEEDSSDTELHISFGFGF